jgi:adenine deaminase
MNTIEHKTSLGRTVVPHACATVVKGKHHESQWVAIGVISSEVFLASVKSAPMALSCKANCTVNTFQIASNANAIAVEKMNELLE